VSCNCFASLTRKRFPLFQVEEFERAGRFSSATASRRIQIVRQVLSLPWVQ